MAGGVSTETYLMLSSHRLPRICDCEPTSFEGACWQKDVEQRHEAEHYRGSVQHLQLPDDVKAMYARPLSRVATLLFS